MSGTSAAIPILRQLKGPQEVTKVLTSAVDIGPVIWKEGPVHSITALVPNRSNIERDRVYDAQKQAQICEPSM